MTRYRGRHIRPFGAAPLIAVVVVLAAVCLGCAAAILASPEAQHVWR